MIIRFNINTQKAVETLLWIIQRGETNVYNAMKILFEADKFHLNTYGRPVTGDRYVAMKHGTVPSWIYEATKLTNSGIGFVKVDAHTLALASGRTANLDLLSESDVIALEHGFKVYAGKDFGYVKRLNHQEKAWIEAVKRCGEGDPEQFEGAADIWFEDMIDEQWLIEDLQDIGHCLGI